MFVNDAPVILSLGEVSGIDIIFADASSDAGYAANVECAKSLGIVTSYEDCFFNGGQPVTRRDEFVMAQRMIKIVEAFEISN